MNRTCSNAGALPSPMEGPASVPPPGRASDPATRASARFRPLADSCRTLSARFFLLSMVFGALIIVVLPPFQSPDDATHFYRAYQVSEGGLVSIRKDNLWGGEIPASLVETAVTFLRVLPFAPEQKHDYRETLEWLRFPLNPGQRVFRNFPNSAYTSPVAYVPQALGIALGRWFEPSPLGLMYLGRLANLLLCSLLIMLAIHLAPVHQEVFFLLGLMPMAMFGRCALSADGATTGLAFVLTALILKAAAGPEEYVRWPTLAGLALAAALAVQCKTVYVFLPFLFFIIPVQRLGGGRRYLKAAALVLGAALLSWLAWSRIVSKLYIPCSSRAAADLSEPIGFILADPVRFLGMIVQNHLEHAGDYLVSFVGVMGWWDTKLPLAHVVLYTLALLAAAACCYGTARVSWRTRGIAGALALASAALLAASQYIVWNAPGSLKIEMMQGRYFIPVAPLGFLALAGIFRPSEPARARARLILELVAVASLAATVVVIYRRYYVG